MRHTLEKQLKINSQTNLKKKVRKVFINENV